MDDKSNSFHWISSIKESSFKDTRCQKIDMLCKDVLAIRYDKKAIDGLTYDEFQTLSRIAITSAKLQQLKLDIDETKTRLSHQHIEGKKANILANLVIASAERTITPPKTLLTTIAHFCINPKQLDDALACLDEIYPRTVKRCGTSRARIIYRWNVACLILGHNKNRLLKGLAIIGGWCGLPTLANLFKQLF